MNLFVLHSLTHSLTYSVTHSFIFYLGLKLNNLNLHRKFHKIHAIYPTRSDPKEKEREYVFERKLALQNVFSLYLEYRDMLLVVKPF